MENHFAVDLTFSLREGIPTNASLIR